MQENISKVDAIYKNFLDAFAQGVYKPGERLIISNLAKENATSEIPVREALRRLESEGYVDIKSNKGIYVKEFNAERALAIFQIKGVLEGYASRIAIDYLAPMDIKQLREINEEMKTCADGGEKYGELNVQFHLTIYKKLPQTDLYDMICSLWKKWGITRSVFAMEPGIIPDSIQDHEKIIQLLSQKDYDGVEKIVRAHKEKAGVAMNRHLRNR